MKTTRKSKKSLPQVHILGDLQDVKNLVSAVNKKKTIVLFHNGEQDLFYLEIGDEVREIRQKDISRLEKDYKLILFSFFPSRKKVEPIKEDNHKAGEEGNPEPDTVEIEEKKEQPVIRRKKKKNSSQEHKGNKEKDKKKASRKTV